MAGEMAIRFVFVYARSKEMTQIQSWKNYTIFGVAWGKGRKDFCLD
jgi:hypothetical protein